MDRKKLLKRLVFMMFFIFIVDFLAQKFYWYYTIWWFDMPMHFLGGMWIGLFFLWFFSIKDLPILKLSLEKVDFKITLRTLLFVLLFGILWEIFEIYVHNYIGKDFFDMLDTFSDVFFDLAGGVFAIIFFFKRIMISGRNEVNPEVEL